MIMARGRNWERRESVWMILSLAAVLPAAGFSCCGRHAAASLVGRGEVGTHGPADRRFWTQRHVRLMMQGGEGRDDWRDSEDKAIALPRSLPSLGRLVISTSEPNVPIPPKPSRFARLLSLIGIRRQGRGMRRRGVAKPAAGVGATVGFMAGGPFGAMLGAVAGAFASTREGAAGEAVRTTAKAAGGPPHTASHSFLLSLLTHFNGHDAETYAMNRWAWQVLHGTCRPRQRALWEAVQSETCSTTRPRR